MNCRLATEDAILGACAGTRSVRLGSPDGFSLRVRYTGAWALTNENGNVISLPGGVVIALVALVSVPVGGSSTCSDSDVERVADEPIKAKVQAIARLERPGESAPVGAETFVLGETRPLNIYRGACEIQVEFSELFPGAAVPGIPGPGREVAVMASDSTVHFGEGYYDPQTPLYASKEVGIMVVGSVREHNAQVTPLERGLLQAPQPPAASASAKASAATASVASSGGKGMRVGAGASASVGAGASAGASAGVGVGTGRAMVRANANQASIIPAIIILFILLIYFYFRFKSRL